MLSRPLLPPAPARRAAQSGSAILTALFTVVVLSLVAANVLSSLSARYSSAYRSAAWNEALLTADAGLDVTLATIASQIPDVQATSVGGLSTGYSQATLPTISVLQFNSNGVPASVDNLVNITSGSTTHGGEGGKDQQWSVGLKVQPLSDLLRGGLPGTLATVGTALNGGDMKLIQLVSTGTVLLDGPRVAGPSRLDNELWRPSFFVDRLSGRPLTRTAVSRQVAVTLRPVRPYEAALVSGDVVLATGAGTVFDSFNSLLATASTNGQYDSQKRLAHGSVRANGTQVALQGTVYGNVGINHGSLQKKDQDTQVVGTVSSTSYVPLPLVNPPTFTGDVTPTIVTGTTTLNARNSLFKLTAQYRFNGITGTLRITPGVLLGNAVEIYVDGDLTGGIEIDKGITAKVYVSGKVDTKASRLKNGTGLAANLQIYGVYKNANAAPTLQLDTDVALAAAVYAPGHKVYLKNSGDFSGAIVGASFEARDGVRVHYDEALAYNVGPLLRYEVANWREIIN